MVSGQVWTSLHASVKLLLFLLSVLGIRTLGTIPKLDYYILYPTCLSLVYAECSVCQGLLGSCVMTVERVEWAAYLVVK